MVSQQQNRTSDGVTISTFVIIGMAVLGMIAVILPFTLFR